MALFHDSAIAGASGNQGGGGYRVERSLRFNSSDSAFCSKTFSSTGNRTSWTWSGWVKRSGLSSSSRQVLFGGYGANNDTDWFEFGFGHNSSVEPSDTIYWTQSSISSYTTAVYRDTSAWYHIVATYDGSNLRFYVNNALVLTSAKTGNLGVNGAWLHTLGRSPNSGIRYFDGYLADVYFIDGQTLTPSSFVETSATTGQLIPKAYTDVLPGPVTLVPSIAEGALIIKANAGTITGSVTAAGFVKVHSSSDGINWTYREQILSGALSFSAKYIAIGGGSTNSRTFNPSTGGSYTWAEYSAGTQFDTTSNITQNVTGLSYTANSTVTAPFGTNGFWLKFSDNSAATATTLGKDYSGNSNNWTPNNFSVLSSYTDTFLSRKPDGTSWTNPTYAFDGTTANYADGTAGNGTVSTIRFNKPLTGVTLLEYFYDGTSTYGYNSTDVGTGPNLTGGSWVTVYSGSAITVNNVRCTSQPGNGVIRLYAIRVNGTILNNWTETDPPGCDSTVDTPTSYGTDTGAGGEVRGNYCTLNAVDRSSSITPTNGNLTASDGTNVLVRGTIFVSSGKWYYECTATTVSGAFVIGVATNQASLSYLGVDAFGWGYTGAGGGLKYNAGGSVGYGSGISSGDVIGVAIDMDAKTLVFYKNNTSLGIAFSNLAGAVAPAFSGGSGSTCDLNFGQRPFAYTAPSGFKALCDTNLPAPVVAKPSTVMDVKLYTGTGSTQTISGLGFSPDFVWLKARSAATAHLLFDQIRGATYYLSSNATDAESNSPSNTLTAFTSDGFTLGSNSSANGSSVTLAAWTWDAGTSTVTNTQGSITSQVRANASAGFSICSWTAPASGNFTWGHGLGVEPHMVIIKTRASAGYNWRVYHKSIITTVFENIDLNSTGAKFTSGTNMWGAALPTSTVVGSTANNTVGANEASIAYCFAPVAGYSAMGSFVGNGSTDGVFVYTGHRSRWLMIKRTDTTSQWSIWDTARNPYNVSGTNLWADSSEVEVTSVNYNADFLSNGFKMRTDSPARNGSGGTYIYISFAESPFQYSRAR